MKTLLGVQFLSPWSSDSGRDVMGTLVPGTGDNSRNMEAENWPLCAVVVDIYYRDKGVLIGGTK